MHAYSTSRSVRRGGRRAAVIVGVVSAIGALGIPSAGADVAVPHTSSCGLVGAAKWRYFNQATGKTISTGHMWHYGIDLTDNGGGCAFAAGIVRAASPSALKHPTGVFRPKDGNYTLVCSQLTAYNGQANVRIFRCHTSAPTFAEPTSVYFFLAIDRPDTGPTTPTKARVGGAPIDPGDNGNPVDG